MFLGSLMFLDFHSGDCSDCYLGFDNVVFWVGYWSCRGTAVSVFSEALFPSWHWSHQHDYARYMGTLLTKFWSLFTTHRQVWNLLFACLLLYHVRYVLCWIGHWTVQGDEDMGSRHKNETACDDQTPSTRPPSTLLTAVNHSEVYLTWGQAHVLMISVWMGVWVKFVSGFCNWCFG
jgi:hypothetical protein